MMRVRIIWLALSLMTGIESASAQSGYMERHHRCDHLKCDSRVQQLDSLVNYRFNENDSSYTPAYVIIYDLTTEGTIVSSKRLDLPLRTPVYNQIFNYDSQGKEISYLYQEWKEGLWVDTRLTEYTYEDNNIYLESFSRKDESGAWFAYQRHFYTYEAGRPVSYLRQARATGGDWYDVSNHYYVYDSAGNLAILYGQYLSTGEIFWKRTTLFDDQGKETERVLQTLKYDPVLKKNVLKNVNHQTFTYDVYGDLYELFTDEWINEQWTYTNKHTYYYSIIPGKKVALCHNGIYICVSSYAVKAHLEHGDILGPCSGNPDDTPRCRCYDGNNMTTNGYGDRKENDYKLYPMPFSSQLEIQFNENENDYTKLNLCTLNGTILYSEKITGRESVVLNTSWLKSGSYLIILTGKNRQSVSTVIKK